MSRVSLVVASLGMSWLIIVLSPKSFGIFGRDFVFCWPAVIYLNAFHEATMFHSQDLKGLAKPIEEQAVYLLVQANSQTGK